MVRYGRDCGKKGCKTIAKCTVVSCMKFSVFRQIKRCWISPNFLSNPYHSQIYFTFQGSRKVWKLGRVEGGGVTCPLGWEVEIGLLIRQNLGGGRGIGPPQPFVPDSPALESGTVIWYDFSAALGRENFYYSFYAFCDTDFGICPGYIR